MKALVFIAVILVVMGCFRKNSTCEKVGLLLDGIRNSLFENDQEIAVQNDISGYLILLTPYSLDRSVNQAALRNTVQDHATFDAIMKYVANSGFNEKYVAVVYDAGNSEFCAKPIIGFGVTDGFQSMELSPGVAHFVIRGRSIAKPIGSQVRQQNESPR